MASRRRAFTLVELLVVVGIVVVLIALLMPALGRVREHALRVACAANLRSIGQALTAYTQTYGYYPGCTMGGPGPAGGAYALWPVRLRRFTGGERRVFHCPAADERSEWPPDTGQVAPRATAHFTRFGYEDGEPLLEATRGRFSYGYNIWGSSPSGGIHGELGLGSSITTRDPGTDPKYLDRKYLDLHREVRASRVKMPSEMIAIADSTDNGDWDFAIIGYSNYHLQPGSITGLPGVSGTETRRRDQRPVL